MVKRFTIATPTGSPNQSLRFGLLASHLLPEFIHNWQALEINRRVDLLLSFAQDMDYVWTLPLGLSR